MFSSCLVVSLHPLGTEKERVWKPELIGTWIHPEAFEMLIITEHPKKTIAQYTIKKVANPQRQWIHQPYGSTSPDTMTVGDLNNQFEAMPDSLKKMMFSFLNKTEHISRTMQDTEERTGNKIPNRERIASKVMFNKVMNSNEDTVAFSANIYRVGNELFLDMFGYGSDRILENFIPIHTFIKLELENGTLVTTSLEDEKLTNLFEEKRIRLEHQTTEEGIKLITAESDKIKGFLKKYTQDLTVFEKPTIYTKQ